MPFVEDNDVIQKFPSKATDHPSNVGVGLHCQVHPMRRMNVDRSV